MRHLTCTLILCAAWGCATLQPAPDPAALAIAAREACAGLSAEARQPHFVLSDLGTPAPLERRIARHPKIVHYETRGVVLRKPAAPGHTALYLQRVLDCQLAEFEAGHAAHAGDHALFVPGTRAVVDEGRGAFLITLEADSADKGRELVSRAEALTARSLVSN